NVFRSANNRSRAARAAGFRLDSALGKFSRSEPDAGGPGGSFRRVWIERDWCGFADANLRRRSSLQMEKRERGGRLSIREMANRIHVSAFRSRPRHKRIISGRRNVS